jgi:hypothetical protein
VINQTERVLTGAPDGWHVSAIFRTEDLTDSGLRSYAVHFTVELPTGTRFPISATFVQAVPEPTR